MIKYIISIIEQNSSKIMFTTGIVVSTLTVTYMMQDMHNIIIRKKEYDMEQKYNKYNINANEMIKTGYDDTHRTLK
jgi:hypothetical protein